MPSEQLTTIYSQHTVYLQRLGATEGFKVTPYLELIENDVVSILNKYRKRKITTALQAAIQNEINESSRKHLQDYTSQLKVENRALGAYEGELAASTLNGLIDDKDFNAVSPSAAAVNSVATITPIKLGDNSYTSYSSMMSNYWQKWSNEVDGIVLNGFQEGTTIREVTNSILSQMEVSKSGTTKSVFDRARRAARSLAVTGTNHYANTARISFVDENDELLEGYRFLAVNDSKTSSRCRSLDQQVFKAGSSELKKATPPLHPHCRSALTFEVADKYKLDSGETKKASSFNIDGKRDPKPIDSDSIYYANMSKLNARDQDNILGPTLGKAFRKMDNPAQFAKATLDDQFNPLTIKQLKQKNNELGRILRAQNKPNT
jgi:SPP1 gp7 family putative phage head morphogenesis protein